MNTQNLRNYLITGTHGIEGNTHLGNVFLVVENGKLGAIVNPNCSAPELNDKRSDAYTLTEEAFCKLCSEAALKTSFHFAALLEIVASCYSEELNTEDTYLPADVIARLLTGKRIPDAFALMFSLSGALYGLKRAAALYRAEQQRILGGKTEQQCKGNTVTTPAAIPPLAPHKHVMPRVNITQMDAIQRILDKQGNLTGLVLSEGGRKISHDKKHCILLAEKGAIKNVKAVSRNGKKYLAGNGVSLETLPTVYA